MPDPRFFANAGPLSLGELARCVEARIEVAGGGAPDPDRAVADVAPLDRAGPDDLSFLDNARYRDVFSRSRAGVCLVAPALASLARSMALRN